MESRRFLDPARFIPGPLLEIGGAGWLAFTAILSDFYEYFFTKIVRLRVQYNPEETVFPGELARTVGAYTSPGDSVRTVRTKTEAAVRVHKRYHSFNLHWSGVIQSIMGVQPSIFRGPVRFGSFIVGRSVIGSPSKIGFVAFEDETEEDQPPGEIRIDIKNAPSVEQIARLSRELAPLVPAYFRVLLGVVDTTDPDVFRVGVSEVGGIDTIGVDPAAVNGFQSYLVFEGGI